MKLPYSTTDLISWINPNSVVGDLTLPVGFINTDTRALYLEKNGCFIGLNGIFRSGVEFTEEAYKKEIRVFILASLPPQIHKDAVYLLVDDPLLALQSIARIHRNTINIPVLAIAGKNGKTTLKEWLYELIKPVYHVVRSPKSYNSKLGVALSLLELNEQANFGIIEIAMNEPNDIKEMIELVQPSHFIVTSFFKDQPTLNLALVELLNSMPNVFSGEFYEALSPNVKILDQAFASPELKQVSFTDSVSLKSASLAIGFAKSIGLEPSYIEKQASTLRRLALRLETFNGKNNSIVINDTYNLDKDAFRFSLEYLAAFGSSRPHCVYVGLDEQQLHKKAELAALMEPFNLDHVFIDLPSRLPTTIPEGAIVLLKGTRKAGMEKFAARLREKQHQTKLEINLSALRNNLVKFKQQISSNVKLLAMVKAQSYGSGLEKLAEFLENQGLDYLGVAYTSEGVALRKYGIKLPILVLNPDPNNYHDCIVYNLEPTIFTFNQLDEFIRMLIESDVNRFPIHVEIDTGMRRLGFEPNEIKSLLEVCQAQPEVFIKGVFSHFVESDDLKDKAFSIRQIERFSMVTDFLKAHLSTNPICHMANSEAILNYPESHFDMVRLGLGMYGFTNSSIQTQMESVLAWKSVVSQVKWVEKGESVSYSRSFIAKENMKIAVIPVGYADGFPRALSNGVGKVRIHDQWCPTVGKVCMDMVMVDASAIDNIAEGEEVVIFDSIQSLESLAKDMQTIPYEVMTGISDRVHRVYISE